MANPIVQRLIAAGASPARANAFAAQFAKSQPSVKTQDLEDAFDEQLGALSQTYFPNVFRPPAVDDPRFDIYLEFIAPGSSKKINDRVFAKTAPTFSAAQKGTPLEQAIAKRIREGKSLGQMLDTYSAAGVATLGNLKYETDVKPLIEKLFNEYNDVQPALIAERQTVLGDNKYYKAGLPDPKLKYGKTEDLSKGIISWKSHPQVEKALLDPKVAQAGIVAKTAPAGYMSDPNNRQGSIDSFNKMRNDAFKNSEEGLFKEFSTSKANPLKDEISRREYLKDKTTR